VEYREKIQRAALDRGLKVQGLIEKALDKYLTAESSEADHSTRTHPPSGKSDPGSFLVKIPSGLSDDMSSRFHDSINNLVRLFSLAEDGNQFLDLAERAVRTGANSVEGDIKRGVNKGHRDVTASGRHNKGGTGGTVGTKKNPFEGKKAV